MIFKHNKRGTDYVWPALLKVLHVNGDWLCPVNLHLIHPGRGRCESSRRRGGGCYLRTGSESAVPGGEEAAGSSEWEGSECSELTHQSLHADTIEADSQEFRDSCYDQHAAGDSRHAEVRLESVWN